MRERHWLTHLGNDELLAALSTIVAKDKARTADLLAHLAECDERRLYLGLGFSSMFAYCTEALGFCEATAWRRITAARVCRRFPAAFSLVAGGELHLSALCSLKRHLCDENAAELFALCRCKSARRIDELLAARFPRPDVRDSIRRLPGRGAGTSDVGSAVDSDVGKPNEFPEQAHGASDVEGCLERAEIGGVSDVERKHQSSDAGDGSRTPSFRTPQENRFARAPGTRARERLEPLSADRFGVHFTVDGEFRELLERVRALAAHRLPSGDLGTLMRRGLEAYERELVKERFAIVKRPRGKGGTNAADADADADERGAGHAAAGEAARSSVSTRSRHVPAAVAREVYVRDAGECTFASKNGRRCGARRFLELDHVVPWALGGEQTTENLRLRCRAHNGWYAAQCFGGAHVRAKVERWQKETRIRHCEAARGDPP